LISTQGRTKERLMSKIDEMKIVNFQQGLSLPAPPGPLPDLISQLSPTTTTCTAAVDYESILSSSKNNKRKLVLHFDINETILIGDEAGGDTVHDCLNKIIAKSAFVQCPPNSCSSDETDRCMNTREYEPTHWWDGTPIGTEETKDWSSSSSPKTPSPPPPLYTGWQWPVRCCPYYRTAYKQYAKTFTKGHHGSVYKPLYDKLERCMLQYHPSDNHHDQDGDDDGSKRLPPTHPFYRMIPSFFYTLVKLQEMKKDYTLVLRTFGSDLDDVALALNDFANGKHPDYPSFREPKLMLEKSQMFRGRYRCQSSSNDGHDESLLNSTPRSIYDLWEWDGDFDSTCSGCCTSKRRMIASGDEEVLKKIEHLSVCGIQDDYMYWDANHNAPSCGKPVWIHPSNVNANVNANGGSNGSYHHLFFDDNIHNDATDSIVAVRAWDEVGNCWKSLSGEETIQQHGKYVVRVPTIAAILQQDWFLQQIALAELNIQNACIN
jgi:hypothetical protein